MVGVNEWVGMNFGTRGISKWLKNLLGSWP
jgi:hypothetical protein